MGLLNALLGTSSELSIEKLRAEIEPYLVPGEEVQLGFQLVRDLFVFTDRRLLLLDKQGITGSKRQLTSIAYARIMLWQLETAGRFDMDSELKLYVQGLPAPLSFDFRKNGSLPKVCQVLSYYTAPAPKA